MKSNSKRKAGRRLGAATLLACPFCGSKANGPEDISVTPKAGTWWQVMCSDEKGTDCCAWRAAASPELVAAKWNMRTNPYQDAYLQVVKDLQYTVERLKEETREKWKLKHALEQANVLAHRSRASDARYTTATRSRDSVQPACWTQNSFWRSPFVAP